MAIVMAREVVRNNMNHPHKNQKSAKPYPRETSEKTKPIPEKEASGCLDINTLTLVEEIHDSNTGLQLTQEI